MNVVPDSVAGTCSVLAGLLRARDNGRIHPPWRILEALGGEMRLVRSSLAVSARSSSFSLLIPLFLVACSSGGMVQEVLPSPGGSAVAPTRLPLRDYARVVPRQEQSGASSSWVVQTSVRVLRNPKSGARVRLSSMAHLGRPEYS